MDGSLYFSFLSHSYTSFLALPMTVQNNFASFDRKIASKRAKNLNSSDG